MQEFINNLKSDADKILIYARVGQAPDYDKLQEIFSTYNRLLGFFMNDYNENILRKIKNETGV